MRTLYQTLLGCFGVTLTITLISLSSHAAPISYSESSDDISNPDRGFYYPYTTSTSGNTFTPLIQADLESRRTAAYTPFNATYTVKSSIALRHYVLDGYVGVDSLPQSFLDNVQTDFDTARAAGVRLILRFSYTTNPMAGNCAAAFICPPYRDAPKNRVLNHIAQLTPILAINSDVILGLQQGFIGTWGENYYSDYFGDPSVNGQGYLTDVNWIDRNMVVSALLNALPSNRMLQVRYPQAKQRYLLGPSAEVTSPAMDASQAFDQSDTARIGIHNDCFVASSDDFGTFADYGNDESPVASGNSTVLMQYAQNDSTYTLVGGETCSDATYNPQNNCASAGGEIVATMEKHHYSYLNSDYNNDVNNDWAAAGCMDEIKQRLGYRFVLEYAELPEVGISGQAINITFSVTNKGFAAAVNPRQLWLVLRNMTTQQEHKFLLDGENTNPQLWLSDSTFEVQASFALNSVQPGNYSLWLHIADPSDNNRLLDRPEYSVQLANQNIWESDTGYNNLNATLQVSASDDDILDFVPAILSGTLKE